MIVFDVPKVILQSREKVKIFNFFDFDHVWSLWTLYVCSGDMLYAVWTQEMSSCGRRICLVVGEEYMSSCWRRIDVFLLEKNRCLLVGQEQMLSCWREIETQVDEEEDRIWQTIHQLSLAPLQISPILQNLDFVSRKVMVMVMVKVMVFKTFEGALRLAAGALFSAKKIASLKKIFFNYEKSIFMNKIQFPDQKHYL